MTQALYAHMNNKTIKKKKYGKKAHTKKKKKKKNRDFQPPIRKGSVNLSQCNQEAPSALTLKRKLV
jgi:ribosomal protein S8E